MPLQAKKKITNKKKRNKELEVARILKVLSSVGGSNIFSTSFTAARKVFYIFFCVSAKLEKFTFLFLLFEKRSKMLTKIRFLKKKNSNGQKTVIWVLLRLTHWFRQKIFGGLDFIAVTRTHFIRFQNLYTADWCLTEYLSIYRKEILQKLKNFRCLPWSWDVRLHIFRINQRSRSCFTTYFQMLYKVLHKAECRLSYDFFHFRIGLFYNLCYQFINTIVFTLTIWYGTIMVDSRSNLNVLHNIFPLFNGEVLWLYS